MSEKDKLKDPSNENLNLSDDQGRGCKRKLLEKSHGRKRINMQNSPEKTCPNAETVEEVLEDMEEEIDLALEHRENKSELTTTSVKNILRHIIANEYVLNMVRNTMQNSDGELGDNSYEPKLTRSKAQEMRNKQCSLPWPVSTPAKKAPNDSQKLLEEEFPDECSSDEDYKPTEEEIPSDDDDDEMLSPKSSERKQTLTPVPKPSEPFSDDESALVIEFPDFFTDSSEADKIALRTRSKLPLNDTPLEAIEASFIAPDITLDMYENLIDDVEWQEFLTELSKPIDTVMVKESTAEEVDDGDDPEYKVVEDDVPDYNDLRYDSSVKITRDELNALMAEILEYAQDLSNLEDVDESRILVDSPTPLVCNETPVKWMSEEERCQLDEQMRMYVQLLTQAYLLSHGSSKLNFINISAKLFLDEIKMFASREMASEQKSAFYAQNLDGALEIIDQFENQKDNKFKRHNFRVVPHHIRHAMAESKVFIYPELLPLNGFRDVFVRNKTKFSPPEDNLIALGLEQFKDVKNPIECIQSLLVPAKTVDQIKFRIKNAKHKTDAASNPIKYYYEFKKAPRFHRVVRIFDPNNIKAPAEYPPEILPRWVHSFCRTEGHIPIAPKAESARKAPAICPPPPSISPAVPEPRHLPPLLPRISPLRHISPILKKYSQQRLSNSPVKRLRPKPSPSSTGASRPVSPALLSSPPTVKAAQIFEKELGAEEERKERAGSDEEAVAMETVTSASVTSQKKPVISKKRNRIQRDMEASLSLLQPNLLQNDPKREEREELFANCYFLRAIEILKGDPEVYEKFLTTLCKYYNSPQVVELYCKMKEILKNYPILVRDFAVFLRPEQAQECGAYQEYTLLTKWRKFFRKVELHFRDQPQHISRIVRAFSHQQVDITSEDVLSTLRPLLRNQSHLLEELQSLLPDAAPPQYLLIDFEDVRLPNSEDENSRSAGSSCEELDIPDTPDLVGGKDCPCPCHPPDTKMLRHCNKCGVKFIDGRIYIQTGKVLKPAQVTYHDIPPLNSCLEKNTSSQPKAVAEATKSAAASTPTEPINGNKNEVQSNETVPTKENEKDPKLPCDGVLEDTVLPGSADGPSDFSELRQILASNETDSVKPQSTEWSKDEDTFIIYNCQRYGVTKKAFTTSAEELTTRTADEIAERFFKLMECISKELKSGGIVLEKES